MKTLWLVYGAYEQVNVFSQRTQFSRDVIKITVHNSAASRFCILQRHIIAKTELAIKITQAIVVLHNKLMKDANNGIATRYYVHDYTDSN